RVAQEHPKDLHRTFVHAHDQVVARNVVGDLEIGAFEDAVTRRFLVTAIQNYFRHATYSSLVPIATAARVFSPTRGARTCRQCRRRSRPSTTSSNVRTRIAHASQSSSS